MLIMSKKQALETNEAELHLKTLLEAHVKYELNQLKDANLQKLVESELSYLLESSAKVNLNTWVPAQTIKDLIKEHVVENPIPGSIADIAGKMSSSIFNSDFHKKTTLKAIISRQQFEEFIDKAIELKEQRNNGLDKLIDLPIYTDLISGILFQSITHYIYDNNLFSKNIPGMSSLLKVGKSFMDKTAPKLGSGIEDSVRTYIANSLELIITESKAFLANSVTDEQLKDSAITLWENLENKSFSDFQKGMDSLDLSEFVVLGYEFWLRFRKTEFFKQSYELIVDYFFNKYGDSELSVLFDDFMLTPERMKEEAERFSPQILSVLKDSGQLEGMIRRRLASFYTSSEAIGSLSKTH